MSIFEKAILGCALLCTVELMRLCRRVEMLHPDYKKQELGLYGGLLFFLWYLAFDLIGAGLLGRALLETIKQSFK